MRIPISAALAALFALTGAVEARTTDKAAQGKVFAIDACSACHVVEPGQEPRPPVYDSNDQSYTPAPTFMDIARSHGVDKAYLRQHITDPQWPMREQMFDDDYLDDIIAYIGSLAPHAHRKPVIHRKSASTTPALSMRAT